MNKQLLTLGLLLGLSTATLAQTPAILPQNSTLDADYQFFTMQAVSPSVAWGAALFDDGADGIKDSFARTNDGGTTWFASQIIVPGTDYQIGGLTAIDGNTAWVAMYDASGAGDGGIFKTTDGGQTWLEQPTAVFEGADAFPNWVHFFNANDGVCMGDPNRTPTTATKFFEIYTTSNGGTTWTRVPRTDIPQSNPGEYGIVSQYYAVGNTIWFLTGYAGGATNQIRVIKSTNKGLTWTSTPNLPITEQALGIAFTSEQNGLVYDVETGGTPPAYTGVTLYTTNNGGSTWARQNFNGPFHRYDVKGIPNTNTYVSVGLDAAVIGNPTANNQFGMSISRDNGANWQLIPNSQGTSLTAIGFLNPTTGFLGGFTGQAGGGGVYKYVGVPLKATNSKFAGEMAAYPNPSTSGVFKVGLPADAASGAQVRVSDALGRQVYEGNLNASSASARSMSLDLRGKAAGIYTLELRSEGKVAQRKLVIE